ncbi:MAG: hypothetical protein AAGK05_19680, partial [Pseudomonadota bacterium]
KSQSIARPVSANNLASQGQYFDFLFHYLFGKSLPSAVIILNIYIYIYIGDKVKGSKMESK